MGVKPAVVWPEAAALSNQLASPLLLACPADPTVRPASNWGKGPGGFVNTGYRNDSISYFLAYHGRMERPHSVAFGDRDILVAGGLVACSVGPVNAYFISFQTASGWTSALHGASGHIQLMDGSVKFLPSFGLEKAVGNITEANDSVTIHLAVPR